MGTSNLTLDDFMCIYLVVDELHMLSLRCFLIFAVIRCLLENDLSLPNATCIWVLIGFQNMWPIFIYSRFCFIVFFFLTILFVPHFHFLDDFWSYFLQYHYVFSLFLILVNLVYTFSIGDPRHTHKMLIWWDYLVRLPLHSEFEQWFQT